ncbi:S9 family peptidase [Fodinisporobacter ferrooxydans]|uniref:Acyl-peptide hydrolase n=1 Tax=Fodinisporobacter ferrooxydans TaxID=2901836 RepID=A0ABY4CP34_9BACL|nr:S9 family peptidase [Alicyclobacillaceae bacterium MYW30-H2]
MRPITTQTLFSLQFSGDPQFSPDGQSIVYVKTTINQEENKYQSQICKYDRKTGRDIPFTQGLAQDKLPKFSQDGSYLAFVSTRSGTPQLFVMLTDGGEPKQLTFFKKGVKSYSWMPNNQLVVAARKDDANEKSDVRVVNTLRYRGNGYGFYGDEPIHLWLVQVDGSGPQQITDGNFDETDPTVSPDGKKIAFVSWREENQVEVTPSLYTVDLDTGLIDLTYQGKGSVSHPVYSPNGKWIAFFGHEHGEDSGYNTELWVVSTGSGEARSLSRSLDRPVGNQVGTDARYETAEVSPIWDMDSQKIYFTATHEGDVYVYSVTLDEKIQKETPGDTQVVTSFSYHSGVIAYAKETPASPAELYLQQNKEIQQITYHNTPLFKSLTVSVPERTKFQARDGLEINGWLLKPPGFSSDQRYPLVLEIHGGPHSSYGNTFLHEFQVLANSGYIVLYTNPRGSHGYGEAFVRGSIGDWGGKDYEDLIDAVDAVARLPYVDRNNLFVTGGSYGGYMTNWMVAHTHIFKAAVTQRSICNLHSMIGTSDIGFWFNVKELDGADIWEDEEFILSRSPIRYANRVQTPVKIIHSEEDFRCPMEQAEQWFTALKRLGVETELVRFPNENHDLSRNGQPEHRVERLDHIVGWFNQYLGNKE